MGRQARVTREEVLRAARECFTHRGYEGTTLAAIAAQVSLSPAALLRHAPTKEALFVAAMKGVEQDLAPLEFLEEMDGTEDPRKVLRRVATTMVPFLQARLRQVVAQWLYFKNVPGLGRMPLPFDPDARPTPPERNLRFLERWIRKSARHGRLRAPKPRATALAFLATVHSFVFLQHVIQVLETPMPLDDYLDTVLDVWTRGAIVAGTKGASR